MGPSKEQIESLLKKPQGTGAHVAPLTVQYDGNDAVAVPLLYPADWPVEKLRGQPVLYYPSLAMQADGEDGVQCHVGQWFEVHFQDESGTMVPRVSARCAQQGIEEGQAAIDPTNNQPIIFWREQYVDKHGNLRDFRVEQRPDMQTTSRTTKIGTRYVDIWKHKKGGFKHATTKDFFDLRLRNAKNVADESKKKQSKNIGDQWDRLTSAITEAIKHGGNAEVLGALNEMKALQMNAGKKGTAHAGG